MIPALLAAALAAAPTALQAAAPTGLAPPALEVASAPAPAELSLEAALSELDRQAPALAASRARADEAASLSRQAAAALLPTALASGGYTRNSDQVVLNLGALKAILPPAAAGGLPGATVIQPLESWSGTLSLRLPLVVPSAWYDTAAARDGARGAAAQSEASRLALRANLAGTAHLGRAAEELVAASERAVASARQLAESARRRLDAGTSAPLDLLRAQTEEVRRQGDLVRARADLDRARRAAGALLGRDAPVRILVAEAEEEAGAVPAEAPLVAQAQARRGEVASADAQVASAEAQVGSAWARLAPQLSASGAAFAADVPYPTGERTGWRATLDLSWPLYDGGFRYGKRREAEARLAGARAAAQVQRLAVGQEVRDALQDLEVARERLRLAREQHRLAGEADATARRAFQAGVASSLDVIDADDRLFQADAGLAEGRARLAMARVALDRALGRGP